MLEVQNLTIGYNGKGIIRDISFSAQAGQLISLIGTNGSGKTTLLKTLGGLLPQIEGYIIVNGQNLRGLTEKQKAKHITLLTTYRSQALNYLTAKQIVELGRYPHSTPGRKCKAVDQAIELTGIKELSGRLFANLSDGEKQKVLLAKTIAQDTPVILLDEPLSFLDYMAKPQILKILKYLALHKNKLIIFSTHEINYIGNYSDASIYVEANKAILTDNKTVLSEIKTIEETAIKEMVVRLN